MSLGILLLTLLSPFCVLANQIDSESPAVPEYTIEIPDQEWHDLLYDAPSQKFSIYFFKQRSRRTDMLPPEYSKSEYVLFKTNMQIESDPVNNYVPIRFVMPYHYSIVGGYDYENPEDPEKYKAKLLPDKWRDDWIARTGFFGLLDLSGGGWYKLKCRPVRFDIVYGPIVTLDKMLSGVAYFFRMEDDLIIEEFIYGGYSTPKYNWGHFEYLDFKETSKGVPYPYKINIKLRYRQPPNLWAEYVEYQFALDEVRDTGTLYVSYMQERRNIMNIDPLYDGDFMDPGVKAGYILEYMFVPESE